MPTSWQELPYAQRFRDVIAELVGKEVKRLRPSASLATVNTIGADSCTVIFPGDSTPVTVKLFTVRPTVGGGVGVGDVVRIEGPSGGRYVTEVVKGGALMRLGTITLTALQTTGSAANMFIDAATGVVSRSTSSRKYKTNIKSADLPDEIVQLLRAVTYDGLDTGEEHIGLIAEELADLHNPLIDLLVLRDEYGEPDAIAYDRLAVILLPIIQRLLDRVSDLERRLGV